MKQFTGLFIILLCFSACHVLTEKTSSDFTNPGDFTSGIEGPATDAEGNIYVVNFGKEGTIGKVTPEGKASLFVNLPAGSIGNGIRLGKQGQMFVADYVGHNILEIDMASKEISVYAHDSTANQPNDIAISPSGVLYASDPNWKDSTGKLWMITEEKGFELLEDEMGTTNGIEVSPDGKKLYVNESIQRKIWVYDILSDGKVTNKQELISFPDFGMDGMRCDRKGNVYLSRYAKGTISVISPEGNLLEEIKLIGEKPSNITFGKDYKKCYVTIADRGCLEVIEL